MPLIRTALRLALGCAAALALGAPALAQNALNQSHDGDYAGVMDAPGGQKLHLILHLKTAGAETSAVLDSLDQGVSIPSSAYMVKDGQVNILFLAAMAELIGDFSPDGQTFKGSWRQGGALPVTLTRTAAAAPAKP